MARTPYQDYEGSRGEFLKLLLEQGEEPSFLRRAKAVEEAWGALLDRCRADRNDMLRWARMRLVELAKKVGGDWSRLAPHLADATQWSALERLYDEWKPLLPSVAKASGPWSKLSVTLSGLVDSISRFNVAWDKYLHAVDLTAINNLRADYNRYYPTEKSAAFGSEDIERLGFAPLAPAIVEDLRNKFPLVELPALR